MASLRRLSINESTVYPVRFTKRPTCISKIRVTNYRYWASASQSGKLYGRSSIHARDAYYTRYARPCGSWARRNRDQAAKKNADQERVSSEPNIKVDSHNVKQSRVLGSDYFFKLLRYDASSAYRYLQKEIERDPHQWIFDPRGTNSAWNAAEWWDRHIKSWSEMSLSSHIGGKRNDAQSQERHEVELEEFRIDPITLRKVPIVKTMTDEFKEDTLCSKHQPTSTVEKTYDIPIKRYQDNAVDHSKFSQPSNPTKVKKDIKLAGFASQAWLAKEGFTEVKDEASTIKNAPTRSLEDRIGVVKIQPSLDRVTKAKTISKTAMHYPPEEVTRDDVDLLRASDIRATSGHIKLKTGPSDSEIKERSQALEKDWNQTGTVWNKDVMQTYNELLEKRKARLTQKDSTITEERKLSALAEFRKAKQHHDELRQEIEQTIAVLKQARYDALQQFLSEETNFVKHNFDSFEQRSRKHVSALNDVKFTGQALVDSKSKQENVLDQQKKLEKMQKDAELVGQIRQIYEQNYGKITIDHKQGIPLEELPNAPKGVDTGIISNPSKTSDGKPSLPPTEELSSSNSAPVRDLLYQSIDNLSIPMEKQKRLKFALRGLPELDVVVPSPLLRPVIISTTPRASVKAPDLMPISNAEIKQSAKSPRPPSKEQSKQAPNDNKSLHPKTQDHSRHQNVDHLQSKKGEEITYVYKILALDRASNEVAVATTTSSIKHKSSVPRSAAGLLVHLDQPAKYFNYMESLDAKGFQLVSGSRTMLVYRRNMNTGSNTVGEAPASSKLARKAHAKTPLREEPVFSGHLKPKERLLRSYQLAHRRANSNAEDLSKKNAKISNSNDALDVSETGNDQPKNANAARGLAGKLVTVVLVVTICYTIGLVRNIKAQREHEEGVRLRREEAAIRKSEAQKTDWSWF